MVKIILNINDLTENEIKKLFQCSDTSCQCHKSNGNVHCPCHDDKNPSMTISRGNGKWLFYCHVGCEDVFQDAYDKAKECYGNNGNSFKGSDSKKKGTTYSLEKIKKLNFQGLPYLRHHIYKGSEPLYMKVIYGSNDDKTARFCYTTDNVNWQFGRGGKSILYNLPGLQKDKTSNVFFHEGEKDVDTMTGYGFLAITTGSSSDKLTNEMLLKLRGRKVILTPDNDEPGQKYIKEIGNKLLGITKQVFVTDLPRHWKQHFDSEIPQKADISDFIEALKVTGQGEPEIKAAVNKLVEDAAYYYTKTTEGNDTTNNTWKPIIPLDEYPLPDVNVYDILPKQWANFVSNVAEVVQVDPLMVLSSLFAIFATTLQRKVEVDLITHQEQLSLYFALIAERGERKSAIDKIITNPLVIYENKKNTEMQPLTAEIRAVRKQTEGRLKYLYGQMSKHRKDLDTEFKGIDAEEENYPNDESNKKDSKHEKASRELAEYEKEAKELELRLITTPEPQRLMLISDDSTVQKLAVRMQQNDERMGIFSSEGGILMDILDPKKNVNVDLYLKGYSGDKADTDRITRDYISLKKPAITFSLMLQPNVVEEFGKNPYLTARGLLDRFVYISCKQMIGNRPRQKKPVNRDLMERYEDSVFKLLGLGYRDTEKKLPYLMQFTEEAERYWDDYYNAVESMLNNELMDIMNYGSKVAGRAARLAGIIHFMKHGTEGIKKQIDLDTMKRACNINTVFVEHARAIFNAINETNESRTARKILNIIVVNKFKEFGHRDISRKVRLKKEEQQPGLNLLINHNYIKKAGAKFILNPELSEKR